MKRIWTENVYTWKYIKTDIAQIEYNSWKVIPWEVVSRINDIWVVAALVENITNNSFVLVEQYRAWVNNKVVELVAGLCDKDISNENIIREEILEETWYTIKQIELIIKESPKSPGIMSEIANTYYAQVEWIRWKQRLGDAEEIEVLEFPKIDLIKYLESKQKEWILVSSWIYSIIWKMLAEWKNILE